MFSRRTTTDLTTSISHALASFLHLAENGNDIYVEYAVRGVSSSMMNKVASEDSF